MRSKSLFIGSFLFFLAAFAGCKHGPDVLVKGPVTYKGEPVSIGTVSFYDEGGKMIGSAAISAGTYQIETLHPGAVKIGVKTPATMASSAQAPKILAGPQPKAISLPAKYADPEKSGLSYTVVPGEQTFPIELK